jgi:hypothetical protein
MWARVVETMLGLWLLLSPFIFHHPLDATSWWVVDLAAGTFVIAVAVGSFHPKLPRLHLVHLVTCATLLAIGWVAGGADPAAAHRNWIVLSLLLLMIAIVPSRSHEPPRAWRRYYEEERGAKARSR